MTDKRVPEAEAAESPEATDADIAEIVRTHEAGLSDLLTAYDLIERHYFTAASATAPYAFTTTNTSTG